MSSNKKVILSIIIFILCLSINCYKIKATDDVISNTQLTYKEIDNQETLISGFDVGTTIGEIINSYFPSEYEVKIYDTQNIDITSNTESKIGTGYKIELYKNNEIIKTYRTILYGDTNGDTAINALDALIVVKNKLQLENFKTEAFQEAGRVNNDTRTSSITPSSIDALSIVKYKLMPDKYNIAQSIYGEIEEKKENLFLETEKYEANGDEDGDGLTNAEEERLGTNVYSIDTDMDGLIDSYEVKESKTNPLVADTDGDGIDDGNELVLGLNPLKADSKSDGVSDGNRTLTYMLEDEDSNISINITGKGNIVSTDVSILEDVFEEQTGLLNKVYNFTTEGAMNNATVKIPYTLNEIEGKGISENNLTVYYLNTDNGTLETINTTVDKEKKELTVNLEHFSYYLIGDKTSSKNVKLNELLDFDGDGYYDGLVLADSGFKPEVNGFSFDNYGSWQSMGGHCAGMAKFAMRYYRNQLPISMEDGTGILKKDKKEYEAFALGYNLENTFFESGDNLYNYKIETEILNYLINEKPNDYYSGINHDGMLAIRDKYVKLLKNIGGTYYVGSNKYFSKIQNAIFDENKDEFVRNVSNNDAQLFKAIYRLYITQRSYDKTFFSCMGKQAYDELYTYLKNGIPVCIAFEIDELGDHEVNAIQIIDDLNGNNFKIAIYDNNYSGKTRYIHVKKEKMNAFAGFTLNMGFPEYGGEYGLYSYSFEYDWNNDGTLEQIKNVNVIKVEEEENPSLIYANLYEDGTLTLSHTDTILQDKTLLKSYGEVSKELNKKDKTPLGIQKVLAPWYDNASDIKTVNILDEIMPRLTDYWFYKCLNMVSIENINNLNMSNVVNCEWMFQGCESLKNLDLSNWNTSNVTNMDAMFWYCKSLETLDISRWNTSNVTNMGDMFSHCESLTNLDLSNWNTSNVAYMYCMFQNCLKLKSLDVSHFNTNNVTSMSAMFENCTELTNLNISNFDTSKVTNMENMFSNCRNLVNLDLGNFNTSNVTNMNCMFGFCEELTNINLSSFDTNKVKDMSFMFCCCKNLINLNLSNFNTSNVTDMRSMFSGCYKLTNLDVSNFNANNVTKMNDMFGNCKSFVNLDLSKFNTGNATDMSEMFRDCENLINLDLGNFNTSNVTNMSQMFDNCKSLQSLNISNFDTSCVTNMKEMFYNCEKLENLNVSSFDTSNVKDMEKMFYRCNKLTNLNVGNFDTSSVTNMSNMFSACGQLTSLDLSNFNTSNVINMYGIVSNCWKLASIDVSNFNTINVIDMGSMFWGCNSLTSLDLSSFNTSNVTNMKWMFEGCKKLTNIYVGQNWVTDNADTSYMFSDCGVSEVTRK